MTDVWLQLAEVYIRRGDMRRGDRGLQGSHQAEAEGRRQPDRRGRRAAAHRASSTKRASTRELAVSVAPAGRARDPRQDRARPARRDGRAARSDAGAGGGSDAADAALRRGTARSTTRASTRRRSVRCCRRARRSRGARVQMNDLNYYIGDSLARLERYARGRAVPARRGPAVPAQHARARRPGHALSRHGPRRRSERAIEELLRVSPTPEARAIAAQLWTMFGEPEKAQRVKIPVNVRLFAPALLAAALAAAPPAASTPVFRSGADLVRFDVRVTDGSGRPITDIRPEELEIVEDGTPRPILLFQHIEEPPGMYQEAALRACPAEVSSNRGAPRGHLYLLVFDQAHIAPGNEQSRGARPRRSSGRASARPIASRSSAFPGPDPSSDSPRIAPAPSRAREGARRAGAQRQERRRQPFGSRGLRNRRRRTTGGRRRPARSPRTSRPTSGRVRRPASRASVDRALQRQAAEEPAVMRKIIVENARTVVAQADAVGARLAPAARRSHRAVPHRRGTQDPGALFRRLPPANFTRAGTGRGGRGPELRRLLRRSI